MNQDFFSGFISGSTFIIICLALLQIGFNKGIEMSIRIIDDYPAAKNVLIKTKRDHKLLSLIIKEKEN